MREGRRMDRGQRKGRGENRGKVGQDGVRTKVQSARSQCL